MKILPAWCVIAAFGTICQRSPRELRLRRGIAVWRCYSGCSGYTYPVPILFLHDRSPFHSPTITGSVALVTKAVSVTTAHICTVCQAAVGFNIIAIRSCPKATILPCAFFPRARKVTQENNRNSNILLNASIVCNRKGRLLFPRCGDGGTIF